MRTMIGMSLMLALLLLGSGSVVRADDTPPDVRGAWQGTLEAGEMQLHLVVKLSRDAQGALSGTLDSLDQGAVGIPLARISIDHGALSFTAPTVQGAFQGSLNAATMTVSGTWTQNGAALPLTLQRSVAPAAAVRPQDPRPPYPYSVVEVTYTNPATGNTLAGTLTLPRGASPAPAVLLIPGSGAQDRDETIFGHHPFLVLADYLTRRGIAVLRVDKRGVGHSTGDLQHATPADFTSDALAGVAYLKTRPEIDARRIGLVGHSEGGLIAPRVATQAKGIAFIVLLAAPGLTGEEIANNQITVLSQAAGIPDAVIAQNLDVQRRLVAVIKTESDNTVAAAQMHAILSDAMPHASDEQLSAMITPALLPWTRFFMVYDPRPTLRKVTCPVLALNGERDLQVSSTQNLPTIKQALSDGGNPDVTVKALPGLNHLFQTCKTGLPKEYATIDETFAPAALAQISEWIVAHTR